MIEEIGCPGWTEKEIIEEFESFVEIYKQSPIKNNNGGMKAPHAFASYFMLKKIKPSTIIESGVWKGQGTFLFEQACPDAEIICLDISFKNLIYKSKNAKYIERDFNYLDTSSFDKDNTICFFDDHQNALSRLQQMLWKGIKMAIFEDNYPASRGDCYSPRKILSNSGLQKGRPHNFKEAAKYYFNKYLVKDCFGYVLPNTTHKAELLNALSLYYEFPPLIKEEKTRWGDAWTNENYYTKSALFDHSFSHELREEFCHYTWMCLVKLK